MGPERVREHSDRVGVSMWAWRHALSHGEEKIPKVVALHAPCWNFGAIFLFTVV